MSEIKIILYYADWCGHCKAFKPEWEKLKKKLQNTNIKVEEYEESVDGDKMNEDEIQGFPTIRIIKDKKTSDYNGKRDSESIYHFLTKGGSTNKISEKEGQFNQCGGYQGGFSKRISKEDDQKFKVKYLKYKAKYLKLKSKLN